VSLGREPLRLAWTAGVQGWRLGLLGEGLIVESSKGAYVRLAEGLAEKGEGLNLVIAESADVGGVRVGGEELWRGGLAVELVGVHHRLFLFAYGKVVRRRQRELLAEYVVLREAYAGMTGAEAAQGLGKAFGRKYFVAEEPVTYVVFMIEVAIGVVEPIDTDVMEKASSPDEVSVNGCLIQAIQ